MLLNIQLCDCFLHNFCHSFVNFFDFPLSCFLYLFEFLYTYRAGSWLITLILLYPAFHPDAPSVQVTPRLFGVLEHKI